MYSIILCRFQNGNSWTKIGVVFEVFVYKLVNIDVDLQF